MPDQASKPHPAPPTPKTPLVASKVGKTTPQVAELEAGVLGAAMLEQDALLSVVDILKPESFYKEAHQHIYRAIQALIHNSEAVDIRTVVTQLRKHGTLEQAGGPAYLAYLTDTIASAAHIEAHARIIVEYAIRRALISVSTQVQRDAYDETMDTFELLDRSEQALFEVAESNIRKSYDPISSLMSQAIKELQAKQEHKDGLSGVPSGFLPLDRLLLGWQKSDFTVVAARPGMGKTSFLLTLLRNAAIDHKKNVALFSLEMSALQLTQRMIVSEAGLSSEKIKRGRLEEYEWQQLFTRTASLSNASIYIDDTPSLSLFEFGIKCRRLKARHNIDLVAIDYLQLMRGHDKAGNREQEIAYISRGIKAIAKELNIPIIAASQLSRAVETRGGDKRPQLSDLRESGAIEQDVDIALFLYRPEYYDLTQDEMGNPTTGLAEVIVAKHRNGPLGKVSLRYIAAITKFETMQESPFDEAPGEALEFVSKESKINQPGQPF